MTWHKDDKRAALVTGLLKRPLVFHRVLVDIPVKVNGKTTRLGILGALMLSQAIYWQVRTTDEEGWFYKTRQDWERETGMTRREQETARRRLRLTPFWEEDNRGFPPRLHYRVDLVVLGKVLEALVASEGKAETDRPIGTDAPKWAGEEAETDQPIGTNAPKWAGEEAETDQPIGTDAPKWAEENVDFDKYTTRRMARMRPPFGTNAPKWAEGALKELLTKTTSKTTSQRDLTATAAIKRARVKPPPRKNAAVAAAEIPPELAEALTAVGWTGSKAEILAAWQQDPERVLAWAEYVQAKGGGGGLLRTLLREEPGYPPALPADDPYTGWAAVDADTPSSVADAHEPEALLPGTPAHVASDAQRWWSLALGQLRQEMPKAAYDTWVAPATLAAYRPEAGLMLVAVENDYARRWLSERVAHILERKISGFAGQPIDVQFVLSSQVQEAM